MTLARAEVGDITEATEDAELSGVSKKADCDCWGREGREDNDNGDGLISKAGLGKVLYVDPREVYLRVG